MHGSGSLPELVAQIRRTIIKESHRAGVGHIGSALSVADVVAALFGAVLGGDHDEDRRDRFILSKGHAALALYAALYHTGRLSAARLRTFCGEGSALGVHPEHVVPGIDFSTGSLGHGITIASGAALAARMQATPRRAFALLSDAELNEGSVWEAAIFAAHHGLSNLVAIIDVNGQQALGYTRNVLDLGTITDRFSAFGWRATEVDGHDPVGLAAHLTGLDTRHGGPHAVVAHTIFGRGISYMENRIEWHYWPMSDQQYEQALRELEVTP
jgi:transketolase